MAEFQNPPRRAALAAAFMAPMASLLSGPAHGRPRFTLPDAPVLGVSYAGSVATIFDRPMADPLTSGVQVLRANFGGPREVSDNLADAIEQAAALAAMEGLSYALGLGALTARADAILFAYQIMGGTGPGGNWSAERSIHVTIAMERGSAGEPVFERRSRRVRLD